MTRSRSSPLRCASYQSLTANDIWCGVLLFTTNRHGEGLPRQNVPWILVARLQDRSRAAAASSDGHHVVIPLGPR